jgi:hypothetical protein
MDEEVETQDKPPSICVSRKQVLDVCVCACVCGCGCGCGCVYVCSLCRERRVREKGREGRGEIKRESRYVYTEYTLLTNLKAKSYYSRI